MESEAVIHLQLEFGCCPDPLTGCVSREGATPMQFTGWIGMHAAIETMLNAAREGGDGHAVSTEPLGGPPQRPMR